MRTLLLLLWGRATPAWGAWTLLWLVVGTRALGAQLGPTVWGPSVAFPAATALWLEVNVPAMTVTAWSGLQAVATFPISPGQPGYRTPVGQFALTRIVWHPDWTPPPGAAWAAMRHAERPGARNPMGRAKLQFAPLLYFHGTVDRASIGAPHSHGCVRMLDEDVVALAALVAQTRRPDLSPATLAAWSALPRRTRTLALTPAVPVIVVYRPVTWQHDSLRIYPDVYHRWAGTAATSALADTVAHTTGRRPTAEQLQAWRAQAVRAPVVIPWPPWPAGLLPPLWPVSSP